MADASLPANDLVNQFNPHGNDTNVWKLLDRIEQIERRLDEIEDRQRTPEMVENNIVFGGRIRMTNKDYTKCEDELEKRIKELESTTGMGSKRWYEIQHEISDLKHELWQSRL